MIINLTNLSILSAFLVFTVGLQPAFTQQKKVNIQIESPANQLFYVVSEIQKAALEKKYAVVKSSLIQDKGTEGIVVKIISDSAAAVQIAREKNLKMPEHLGWQCYAIRVQNDGKQKNIYILAAENAGAIYGGLDIAEAISNQTIDNIKDTDNKP